MQSDLEFNKNEDQFKQLVTQLQHKAKKIKLGGGEKKIDEQHQKGKLTARERIQYLVDKDSRFLEIGLFTAEGMYKEQGGCPSGGVVTGIGYVAGRQCVIVANDASAFDAETNHVTLITGDGKVEWLPELPKSEVAKAIIEHAVELVR